MPPITKSGYDMGDKLNPKLPNREVLNVGFTLPPSPFTLPKLFAAYAPHGDGVCPARGRKERGVKLQQRSDKGENHATSALLLKADG